MIERDDCALLLVDMQERLVPFVTDHKSCIEHCQWILEVAQALRIPVYTSQQYPEKLGNTIKALHMLINTENIINKLAFSVYRQPEGLTKIHASNKKQWILMGIETHVCVFQTAMELTAAGHEVFVVEEATQSRNLHDKLLAIERMRQTGISIISREMAVFEWLRVAGTAEFKGIIEKFIK